MIKTVLAATALVLLCTSTASAQVIVLGNGAAKRCYDYAKMGNSGSISAIRTCDSAFSHDMSFRDKAATYVNRGVLLMRKGDYVRSREDYERAIKMQPKLDQAYINYGATLFYLGEYDNALAALNTSIDLGTEKMPEALYNRALVYHERRDYRSAYYDLKKALDIRPDWVPAQQAITRYDVKSRS